MTYCYHSRIVSPTYGSTAYSGLEPMTGMLRCTSWRLYHQTGNNAARKTAKTHKTIFWFIFRTVSSSCYELRTFWSGVWDSFKMSFIIFILTHTLHLFLFLAYIYVRTTHFEGYCLPGATGPRSYWQWGLRAVFLLHWTEVLLRDSKIFPVRLLRHWAHLSSNIVVLLLSLNLCSCHYHCQKTYFYGINHDLLRLSGIKIKINNVAPNSGQY